MSDFKFSDKYESRQTDFTISQMTLEILSDMLGDETYTEIMTIVRKTFDSLAKSKSSEALTLFGSCLAPTAFQNNMATSKF